MGIRLPKFGWFVARPKTAWCCRWVLGSVAVLALAAWVFTLFACATWCQRGFFAAYLYFGGLSVCGDPVRENVEPQSYVFDRKPGFSIERWIFSDDYSPTLRDRFVHSFSWPWIASSLYPGGRLLLRVRVPMWLVLLLTAPPALSAWRNRWVVKRDVGTCRTCGYDRTGLKDASAACPECGTVPGAGRRA